MRAVDDDDRVVGSAGSPEQPHKVDLVDELDEALRGCRVESRQLAAAEERAKGATKGGDASAWLSLSLEQDFAFISGDNVLFAAEPAGQGVLLLPQDGVQYHGTPHRVRAVKSVPGSRPQQPGSCSAATWFSESVSISACGSATCCAVADRSPTEASISSRCHAEARLSYFFSGGGINGDKLAPFALVGGGIAQIDAKKSVPVIENQSAPPPANQIDNPPGQHARRLEEDGRVIRDPRRRHLLAARAP